LEQYASKSITKQDLLNALNSVSKEVCGKIPKDFISQEQCTSFVSLYGPYTVDMILSQSKPSEICGSLKLCDSGVEYQLLYPVIGPNSVVYRVQQDNGIKKGASYHYRLFLGSPAFLDEETLTVGVSESDNVDFQLIVSNKTSYTRDSQCFGLAHMDCTVYTTAPGRGVWYYITLKTTQVRNGTAQFNLTATVQNEIIMDGADFEFVIADKSRVRLLPVIFPMFLLALCVCCLCAARRRCKRTCKNTVVSDDKSQVAVDMQEMPTGVMGQQDMVGYYYYSQNGVATAYPVMPKYVQVPLQSAPQAVYVPQPE